MPLAFQCISNLLLKRAVWILCIEIENISKNLLEKQTYLALGFGLVAAAAEQVDATPMEGFAPDAVDAVLGLKELGLHSAVALTLGYRDAANDYLVNAKKVRRTHDKLVIKK